jgi:hypothetical protein
MLELPDIVVPLEVLECLVRGWTLRGGRLASPFRMRSADPGAGLARGGGGRGSEGALR